MLQAADDKECDIQSQSNPPSAFLLVMSDIDFFTDNR